MKQYTQSTSPRALKPVDPRARDLSESQQKIATLENRIFALSSTVELQSRQLRRLEAAIHKLESRT